MASGVLGADKYEKVLSMYNWQSAVPPRGYQYGVGRGARPIITSAELSAASATATTTTRGGGAHHHKRGAEAAAAPENDFFAALDKIEARTNTRRRRRGSSSDEDVDGKKEDATATTSATTATASTSGKVKLSLEDLATVEANVVGPALTTRNARQEEGELAEQYLFADERHVVTAHDVLLGKTTAAQHTLQGLLESGSPEEPTTWVTHSRAYREMGMPRKATATLREGCTRLGPRAALIWKEYLKYIPVDDIASRRRALADATAGCPEEESLWLERLACEPPHEQLHVAQQAVLACPTGEALWLRVLAAVPSREDQEKIIKRALQRTPRLPRLWARLARLQVRPEVGRQLFHSAGQKYPSLILAVEAAKFAEHVTWQQHLPTGRTLAAVATAVGHMAKELEPIVAAARDHYLPSLEDYQPRAAWLQAAEEAATEGYLWTAGYLLLYCVLPRSQGKEEAGPRPRLTLTAEARDRLVEDATGLAPDLLQKMPNLLALWAMWLLGGVVGGGAAAAAPTRSTNAKQPVSPAVLKLMQTCVSRLPSEEMEATSAALALEDKTTLTTTNAPITTIAATLKAADEKEEEEEEELPKQLAPATSASAMTTAAAQVTPPPKLFVLLACTLQPYLPGFTRHTKNSDLSLLLFLNDCFCRRKVYPASLFVLHCAYCAVEQGRPADQGEQLDAFFKEKVHIGCATATVKAMTGDLAGARDLLESLTIRGEGDALRQAEAWCALVVLERSLLPSAASLPENPTVSAAILKEGRDKLTSVLQLGLQHCPYSAELWLLRLQVEACYVRQQKLRHAHHSELEYQQAVRGLRQLCSEYAALPLQIQSWRAQLRVVVYLVDTVQSSLLQDAARARALLEDTRLSLLKQLQGLERAEAEVQLGLARAHVEQRHGGNSAALDVVREVIQHIPKTREGALLVPAGALLALMIDLEVPSARGKAAAKVMRDWKSRDPLALVAVARLYHAAHLPERAMEQAVKAVLAPEGSGGPCCGDAAALLYTLAQLPAYAAVVRRLAEVPAEAELHPLQWVWYTLLTAQGEPGYEAPSSEGDQGTSGADKAERQHRLRAATPARVEVPRTGTVWKAVTEEEDPTNVTLAGYREPLETMLSSVGRRLLSPGEAA